MIRLLGALLLMGGGLWLGLERARTLVKRRQALDAWAQALALLEGELAFSLPAMPLLLERVSRRAEAPAREVLDTARGSLTQLGERSFPQLWSEALHREPGGLAPEELEQLDRLGELLSQRSWEDQRTAAEAVRQTLLARREQVAEALGREGKTYGTLGLALGTFLTILLL